MNSATLGREINENDVFDSSGAGAAVGHDLDLGWLKAAVYRSRWLLAGGTAVGVVTGIVIAMLSTPIYTANSTIQIEGQALNILGDTNTTDTSGVTNDDAYLQTQVAILQSRTLAERVARSLGFTQDPSFFDRMEVDRPETPTGSEGYQRTLVEALQGGLAVTPTPDTRLVSIQFSSPDPKLAQQVANAMGEQFIESTLRRRFDTSDYSRKFLQQQIDQTRVQLERSERALIAFSQSAGLTDINTASTATQGKPSLTEANLSTANDAYAKARTDRVLAEQRWNAVARMPLMAIPEVVANSTVLSLDDQRSSKGAELRGEMERHSDAYPTVQKLKAEIAGIDAQMDAVAKRIRGSIREQYEIARQQEASLQSNVAEQRQTSINEQGRGVQLSILRRDADTNRALYDALLQRYRELNATAGVTINNISVIDQAELPRFPVWPKPALNALIGAIIGLLLGALVALVRERLDDTIRSPNDVERKLGLPLIGVLPLAKEGKILDEFADPTSSTNEAIYSIRTALQLATTHGVPRSLAMTSTQESEGKSTMSMAIARELALSGVRTLLVDADLRRPSLHRLFELDNARGLSSFLAGQASPEEAIQPTQVSGLSVMTSGPLPLSAPRLLTSESLTAALGKLAPEFDVIMLDCPPVLGLADSLQLASAAEATLFVHEAGRVSQFQARAALRRLAQSGASLIGVILTKFDFSREGYSNYGYTQRYYSYGAARDDNA
jgi:capsular exopolysaccharide synthesis family protein